MFYHEPGFYRRAQVPAGENRLEWSKMYKSKLLKLATFISNGLGEDGRQVWSVDVNENEVNSFFQEDFLNWPDSEALKRQGISDLRFGLDKDRIRVAFRYGRKPWQTVISFDLHVWLVKSEFNVMAIELTGRHAGAVPISAQSLLESIAEQARGKNLEITWYHHNGNPVALVRFQSDKARPTFQLRGIAVERVAGSGSAVEGEGRIVLSGQCLEPGQDLPASGEN
jgi:hypothetical protein